MFLPVVQWWWAEDLMMIALMTNLFVGGENRIVEKKGSENDYDEVVMMIIFEVPVLPSWWSLLVFVLSSPKIGLASCVYSTVFCFPSPPFSLSSRSLLFEVNHEEGERRVKDKEDLLKWVFMFTEKYTLVLYTHVRIASETILFFSLLTLE